MKCVCLSVFSLLATIPLIAAECGVYDRMVVKTDSFCRSNNRYPVHIGEESEHDNGWQWTFTVDESSKGKCHDDPQSLAQTSAKVNFRDIVKSASKTSGCKCHGRYELMRSNVTDTTDTTTYTVLYMNKDREVDDPYYSFTKRVIQKLLKHQYYYLYMSHFFKSADQYFPNVAGFFRGYVDRALEMAENGIKYTLAKKETLALMQGLTAEERTFPHFPMYDIFHHDKDTMFPLHLTMETEHFFLGGADAQITETGMIEQAFKQAVHWEKTIMAELVRVSMLADKICDTELAEYISAEMMPGQRTTLKLLESHRMTLKQMESSGRVAEFLFDSQL